MRIEAGRVDTRTLAALVTTLIFWGSAFPFLRLALQSYHPGHLTLVRFLTASAAMVVIAIAFRMPVPRLRWWLPLAGLSLINVIGYHVLLNFGLVAVQAGPASLIVNTAPVFSYIAAGPILREHVDARAWLGLLVCLIGMGIIAFSGNGNFQLDASVLLLVGCAITWGVSSVLVKPLLVHLSALQVAAMTLWFGTAGLLVFAPGVVDAVREAPPAATYSIVYLGVFPIAVSYATWNYVLAHLPATVAVNYTYLIPLIALLQAFVMLGERPGWPSLLGGFVALGGVILANAGRKQNQE